MSTLVLIGAVLLVILLGYFAGRRRSRSPDCVLLRVRETRGPIHDADTLIEAEFWDGGSPDLHASVYRLSSEDQLVQAYCEHYAHVGLGPPGTLRAFRLEGLGLAVRYDDNNAPFPLLRIAHHELALEYPKELHAIAQRLLDAQPGREVYFSKEECSDYVRRMIQSRQREWLGALADLAPNRRRDWVKFAYNPRIKRLKMERTALRASPSHGTDRGRMAQIQDELARLETEKQNALSLVDSG